MALGSLANQFDNRLALDFRGSSVLNQSYPVGGYAATVAFSPLSLFAAGEQGVWYDPSDLTTMFEDSAGTTAVHAPGNGTADSPVGKILDKSGRGNHATQTTSTARPTLSAKYNLLTYTEQFDNAAWVKWNTTSVTANAAVAPDGTTTADKLTQGTTNNFTLIGNATTITLNVSHKFSVYAKDAGGRYLLIRTQDNSPGELVCVDLTTQSTLVSGGVSVSVTNAGSGWYLIQTTVAPNIQTTGEWQFGINQSLSLSLQSYQGDGTSGIYLWGADLRVTNDGVGLPAYQKVVDANTYDTTGFPYYLKADGVDDVLITPSAVNFTSTQKITNFLGIRRLTNVNYGCFVELGNFQSDTGSFNFYNGDTYLCGLNAGAVAFPSTITTYTYPISHVITESFDTSAVVAANQINLRVNGSNSALNSFSSAGSAVFANKQLSIFARYTGQFYCLGRIYGIIVRGASSNATDISNTETWMNGKTKAY